MSQLSRRLAAAREASRARVAARMTRPLSPEQRGFDPLLRSHYGWETRRVAVAFAVAVGIHAIIVVTGLQFREKDEKKKDQRTTITMQAPKPPPPPPEPPPPPPPEPEPPKEEPKKVASAEPAPPPKPIEPPPKAEPPKPPPVRVGITLDSTVEGGGGPAFATGNTRAGETEKVAKAPEKLPEVPADTPPNNAPPAPVNQTATRIPGAGAGGKLVLPKRKKSVKPEYPATLKAQGIEADVAFKVVIDETGKIASLTLVKSSGYPEFDEAAKKAVMSEEWEPGNLDGRTNTQPVNFTVRFRLED